MATLYEKVGRRYKPVQDTDACNGLTNGSWLITVQNGLHKCRKPIDDEEGLKKFAAITRYLEEWIANELMKLSAYQYGRNAGPLSAKEKEGYAAWESVMGKDSIMWMTKESAYGVAKAICKKLLTFE